MTGAGNQRAVPIKPKEPELENYLEPERVEPPASVPFMITKRMEADLRDRGYSQASIDRLTPQQANEILAGAGPSESRPKPSLNDLRQMFTQDKGVQDLGNIDQPKEVSLETSLSDRPDGGFNVKSPHGNLIVRPIVDQSGKPTGDYETFDVYVEPEARRQGVATNLYREAQREVESRGGKLLSSTEQTPAGEALNAGLRTSREVARKEIPPLEPSITSARKEMMKGDRAELDLPELPAPERKSWRQSLSEAKPQEANTLADEVLARPRALNDSETASLVVRAQEIKNRHSEVMKEIGAASDPEIIAQKRAESEALESEFDKLTEATKKSGTEKGRTLAAQKLTINQDFDLVSMKNRLKAAKGENLTPQENAKIEELHARLNKAEADLVEANEKLAQKDLQRQIDRASRRRERSESKKSLDEEFAALQTQFAKARAEIKGIQASGLAGLDPEGKLTILIGKMARNRVRAGATDAAQLVDDIHAAIKDSIEGITKRDIRDAISGYGVEPKGDKRSEDAKRLAQIRAELKSLSKTEDVEAGRRLSARDSARQKQLEKQEADLTRRMKTGDFERPERNKPQYTRETYEKEKAVKQLKADFEKMRYRATRSFAGKLADTAVGVGNVPKTLLSMTVPQMRHSTR
jgi:ribosomal protein S18 acetylase RimI-like enzyme